MRSSSLPRSFRLLAFAAATLPLATGVPAAADPRPKPRQIVIVSFDGAHDLAQWHRSRALATRTGARFTYFLSCVFLLSPDTRTAYRPPGRSAGRSNVGFAQSPAEVAARLWQIWLAHLEGHDIASHGCGHFDGKDWTAAQWRQEFSAFRTILRDAWTINGLTGQPGGWTAFAQSAATGFRAPYLSAGKALHRAEADSGLRYDASGISRGPVVPAAEDGLLRFSLPTIPDGPAARPVIAMDYNLFVRHSGGFERTDIGAAFENRAFDAFKSAFDAQYEGRRIPLQIGFHFVLMNGGAYWRALERFAGDVCLRADVDCISYADYVARRDDAPRTVTNSIAR